MSFREGPVQVAAAIRKLPANERFELLAELWNELDHTGPIPDWHQQELDRRLDTAGEFVSWSEARAKILGSK